VGLAVELEHQRDLTGVLPVELPGQADLDGDAVEAALHGQPDDVPGVGGLGMAGEIPGTVLEPVVVRQEDRGAVPHPVLVQDPVQPGLLPGAEAQFLQCWSGIHFLTSMGRAPAASGGRGPVPVARPDGNSYLADLTATFLTSSFFSVL